MLAKLFLVFMRTGGWQLSVVAGALQRGVSLGVEGCPRRPRGSWVSSLLLEEQGLQLVDLRLHRGKFAGCLFVQLTYRIESHGVGVVFVHFFLVLLERVALKLRLCL